MYRLFQENPQGVSEGWREFFADYMPAIATPAAPPAPPRRTAPAPGAAPAPAPAPRAAPGRAGNGRGPVVLDGETAEPLRGAAARIVNNMEASLEVPTATSVRAVPGEAARGQPPDPQQPPRARAAAARSRSRT